MRKWFYISTALFWLTVAAFWGSGQWMPGAEQSAVVAAPDRVISPAELARHDRPGDCWMAIRGAVYDLGAYVPGHPTRPEVILPWCGKEATEAYETKTRGRSHSPYADELLSKYRIGSFANDAERNP